MWAVYIFIYGTISKLIGITNLKRIEENLWLCVPNKFSISKIKIYVT